MTNLNHFFKVGKTAVLKSSPIFSANFGKPKNILLKNNDPRNLVTEIDKKIENLIRSEINKNFPTHKIIGEEFGSQKISTKDFVWIIDPVDGTTNYIQGLPFCCISLGLWQGNTPLVGLVYNPISKEFYTAIKNKGSFLNQKRITVSKKKSLSLAYGGFGWGRNIQKAQVNFPKLLPLLHKVRTIGSATLELCMIAKGVFDFHIQSEINVWDFAAACLVVSEAGGKISELNGKQLSIHSANFLASNKILHSQMIREFKKAVII